MKNSAVQLFFIEINNIIKHGNNKVDNPIRSFEAAEIASSAASFLCRGITSFINQTSSNSFFENCNIFPYGYVKVYIEIGGSRNEEKDVGVIILGHYVGIGSL